LNKEYKDYQAPFYGLNDEVPILLTIILGLQHALTMIGSIVSPPLAIAGGAFNFDATITQYLVSAAFITAGLATFLQVPRVHLKGTPYYTGTGLLSVVGPIFDILPIAFNYTDMRYANGTCPDAWGAILGSMMCCVWIQICMSVVPPKTLNKIFPKTITGSLLLLVGVYLISNGMQNWGGSSNCNGEQTFMRSAQILMHPSLYPGQYINFNFKHICSFYCYRTVLL
jgi:xanthine/uracil permease